MTLSKLTGNNILVTPYEEKEESVIIKPDTAEFDMDHPWYKLEMVGEDVDFEEGTVVLIYPQVVKRQAQPIEINGKKCLLLSSDNIAGIVE